MKRLRPLIFALLGLLTAAAVVSCSRKGIPVHRHVLVIHAQAEDFAAYPSFDSAIEDDFLAFGVKADIRNIYLDINHHDKGVSALESGLAALDGWEPDLVAVERDKAYHLLEQTASGALLLDSGVPVLAFGIQFPDALDAKKRTNLCIIHDEIDYLTNIELAYSISDKSMVMVELDENPVDSLNRSYLEMAIASSPKYIDNLGFTQRLVAPGNPSIAGKIMIIAVSAENPLGNLFSLGLPYLDNDILTLKLLNNVQSLASYLCIADDPYTNTFADANTLPQFTAMRESFENGTSDYICGYFAPYGTVASDIAKVGSSLLSGIFPEKVLHHEASNFMDWRAMRRYGFSYDDYAGTFNVLYAPLRVSRPYVLALLLGFILFALAVAAYIILRRMHSARKKRLYASREMLQTINSSLNSVNGFLVGSVREFKSFCSDIHTSSILEYEQLLDETSWDYSTPMKDDFGVDYILKSKQRRLKAGSETSGTARWWWVISCSVLNDAAENMRMFLFFSDNDRVSRENRMKEAERLQAEAARRDNFIKNISHQMRTPLNSIIGFSELVSSGAEFSNEEKREMSRYVRNDSEVLHRIVDNILKYSRYESGRVVAKVETLRAKDIIDEVLSIWNAKDIPDLNIKPMYTHENILVDVDREKVVECFNQLIDNSLRFSDNKSVYIGWYYRFGNSTVEFFVEDEGWGIERDMLKYVDTNFWKVDDYSTGAGLGLNIVKAYTTLMGGTFSVDSMPGVGTKVKMAFSGRLEGK